ncbi:MAG: YCF48-related protein, partial [Myxococcales bacterium]
DVGGATGPFPDESQRPAWTPCTSPHLLSNLTEGWKMFEVRGTDRATNVGQAAQHVFQVDLSVPPPGVPTGVQPDPSFTSNTTPTFTWTAQNAESYAIELSTDPTFADATRRVLLEENILTQSFTPTSSLASGVYYVRVRSTNETGDSAWSTPGFIEIRTWEFINPRPHSVTNRAVTCADASTCWAAGVLGTTLRTTDGGRTFRRASAVGIPLTSGGAYQDLNGIARVNGTTLVAVGNGGTIVRSTDAGNTWRPAPVTVGTVPTGALNAVAFLGQNGWIVGESGVVLRSSDGGATWTRVTVTGFSSTLRAIALWGPTHFVAVGGASSRVILRTTDGVTFNSTPTVTGGSTSANINAIDFVPGANAGDPPALLVAASNSGWVLRSTDGGANWTNHQVTAASTQPTLNAVVALDANTIVTFGNAAASTTASSNYKAIRVSTNAGSTWADATVPFSATLRGVARVPGTSTMVAVGDAGTILRSDDGTTFAPVQGNGHPVEYTTDLDIRGVRVVDANNVFFFGGGGYVARTTNRGQTVVRLGDVDPNAPNSVSTTPESILAASFVSPTVGYVCGHTRVSATSSSQAALIAKTTDGGLTWSKLTLPTTTATSVTACHFPSENLGFATAGGAIWRWDGTQFNVMTAVPGQTTTTWTDMRVVPPTGTSTEPTVYLTAYSSGTASRVARGDGTTWVLETLPGARPDWMRGVALGGEHVFAIGDETALWKRDTNGTWRLVYSNGTGLTNGFRAITFSDANNGYAIGDGGHFVVTTDGGETWTRTVNVFTPYTSNILGVGAVGNDVYVT